VSKGESARFDGSGGLFERRPWGWGDLVALLVWTVAIAGFFWGTLLSRFRNLPPVDAQ